ncbi:MAG: LTA synthase family protein, partial [Planctomycetota bacterium]
RPGTRQLSQNDRPEQAYPGSLARAFADAGYETGFYYGGPLDWRELDRFLPAQGFERMVGQAELAARMDLDPKRDGGEWGLWDEHLLAAVEEDLRGATAPQFMVVFTTSNHPPHELPEGVDLPPLTPPAELLAQTGPLDATQARQLRTYQYACHELGAWLDRLEDDGLLERSIVGVTGDHTAGMRLPQSRRGLLLERAVPFLLLLPTSIRVQVGYHPELPGSHEDVGPTLLHAAGLAGEGLRGFGQSLLDPTQPHLAANAAGILLDRQGAVVLSGPSLITTVWEGGEGLFLDTRAESHDPTDLVRRYAASLALVDGLVYAQEIDPEIRK